MHNKIEIAKNRILKTEQQSKTAQHKLDELEVFATNVKKINDDMAVKVEKMDDVVHR